MRWVSALSPEPFPCPINPLLPLFSRFLLLARPQPCPLAYRLPPWPFLALTKPNQRLGIIGFGVGSPKRLPLSPYEVKTLSFSLFLIVCISVWVFMFLFIYSVFFLCKSLC